MEIEGYGFRLFLFVNTGFSKTAIFTNLNPEMTSDSYEEKFPYVITKKVILKNVTPVSGKALIVSGNPYMFRDVKVVTE